MDRIAKADVDGALDLICERLGMMPPWTQWTDKIAPMSAKRGQIQPLRSIIGKKLSGKKAIEMDRWTMLIAQTMQAVCQYPIMRSETPGFYHFNHGLKLFNSS